MVWVRLYILDHDYVVDEGKCRPEYPGLWEGCPTGKTVGAGAAEDVVWGHVFATGFGLRLSDVDGDAVDEVVLTWPYGFHSQDRPLLYRGLTVFGVSGPPTSSIVQLVGVVPLEQAHVRSVNLVAGDTTGESLRVGCARSGRALRPWYLFPYPF